MPIKIDIPGGGTDTSDATASASDILSGKTAYVNDQKITGTIQSKGGQTYTPSTTNQTIASGQYLAGTQTIKGDSNLKSANIKSGISIFGVSGSVTPLDIKNSVELSACSDSTIDPGNFIEFTSSPYTFNPDSSPTSCGSFSSNDGVALSTPYGYTIGATSKESGKNVIWVYNQSDSSFISVTVSYGLLCYGQIVSLDNEISLFCYKSDSYIYAVAVRYASGTITVGTATKIISGVDNSFNLAKNVGTISNTALIFIDVHTCSLAVIQYNSLTITIKGTNTLSTGYRYVFCTHPNANTRSFNLLGGNISTYANTIWKNCTWSSSGYISLSTSKTWSGGNTSNFNTREYDIDWIDIGNGRGYIIYENSSTSGSYNDGHDVHLVDTVNGTGITGYDVFSNGFPKIICVNQFLIFFYIDGGATSYTWGVDVYNGGTLKSVYSTSFYASNIYEPLCLRSEGSTLYLFSIYSGTLYKHALGSIYPKVQISKSAIDGVSTSSIQTNGTIMTLSAL